MELKKHVYGVGSIAFLGSDGCSEIKNIRKIWLARKPSDTLGLYIEAYLGV